MSDSNQNTEYRNSTETVWNVLEAGQQPSPIYLRCSDHARMRQYDDTRKSSALTYAADLRAWGHEDVRVYRCTQERRYGRMTCRTFAPITILEVL